MPTLHEKNSSPSSDIESRLRALWMAAQAGDEYAYQQALELMAKQLRRFFRRRMLALSDAVEDLVQETLLAIHVQRGTYDPSFPVSAWLMAIARHKLVDMFRRHGRKEGLHDEFDEMNSDVFTLEEAETNASRDLDVLLQSLPASQRLAIELTKLEGLSVAEAATRMEVSHSSIKVLVHRGLKRLTELVKS